VGARDWRQGLRQIALQAGRGGTAAPELLLVSELRAARADERLQRAAKYLPSKAFDRVERGLKRAGVSLDTSEWFYFRSADLGGLRLQDTEGWVLWRPLTGERLAFLPASPSASAKVAAAPNVASTSPHSRSSRQRTLDRC